MAKEYEKLNTCDGFPKWFKNLPANAGAQETQVWFPSWEDPALGGGSGNSL